MADLIESYLAAKPDVVEVERDQIDLVLREQQLGASESDRTSTALKLGRLLSANVLVFVDGIHDETSTLTRVQAVETATGVVLASECRRDGDLQNALTFFGRVLDAGVAKSWVPSAKRRYVSVLGVSPEEDLYSLLGVAEALGMFLDNDLGRAPDVFLLNRDHLDMLSREGDLADAELSLKSSTVLVDCGIRHGEQADVLRIRVTLRRIGGEALGSNSFDAPLTDIARTRQVLASEVLANLDLRSPPDAVADAQEEAGHFLALARIGSFPPSVAEARRAVRAAEAAFALAPGEAAPVLLRAHKSLSDAQLLLRAPQLLANEPSAWTPAQQVECLQRIVRVNDIWYRSMRDRAAKLPAGGDFSVEIPDLTLGPEPVLLTSVLQRGRQLFGPEVRALLDRVKLQQWAAVDLRLALLETRASAVNAPAQWWQVLGDAVVNVVRRCESAEEWAQHYRKYMSLALAPPPPFRDPQRLQDFMERVSHADWVWRDYARDEGSDSLTVLEDAPCVREIRTWLKSRDEPIVRMGAQLMQVRGAYNRFSPDVQASADMALDIFAADRLLAHPERQVEAHDDSSVIPLVSDALGAFPCGSPRQLTHLHDILDPLVAADDAERLALWISRLDQLNEMLAHDDRAKAAAWLAKALHLFNSARDSQRNRDMQQAKTRLLTIRAVVGDPVKPVGGWQDYDIVRIPLPHMAMGATLRGLLSHDGKLALVHMSFMRGNTMDFLARSGFDLMVDLMPVAGGALERLGTISAPPDPGGLTIMTTVNCTVSDGENVYVGTSAGLAVFGRKRQRFFREGKGLPGKGVTAAACLRKKVYLAVGSQRLEPEADSAFYSFDPQTDRFTLLASSRSRAPSHLFDGVTPYAVIAMAADEERNVLWVGARVQDPTQALEGLFRYAPSAQEAHAATLFKNGSLPTGLIRVGAGEVLVSSTRGVVRFDPETSQVTELDVGDNGDGKRPNPLLSGARTRRDDCAVVGDDLFLCRDGSLLLCRGKAAAASPLARTDELQDLQGVGYFVKVSDQELILGGWYETLWRIRRSASRAAPHGVP